MTSHHDHPARRLCAPMAALLALTLGACAAQPPAAAERPALLTAASPQCRAGIEQAVASVLQAPVFLPPDTFTTVPTLLLEHKQPRDAAGRHRDGRSLDRPLRVTLTTDGRHCFLVTSSPAGRIPLDACDCRPSATH